jgi:hypothetical protein
MKYDFLINKEFILIPYSIIFIKDFDVFKQFSISYNNNFFGLTEILEYNSLNKLNHIYFNMNDEIKVKTFLNYIFSSPSYKPKKIIRTLD